MQIVSDKNGREQLAKAKMESDNLSHEVYSFNNVNNIDCLWNYNRYEKVKDLRIHVFQSYNVY